MRWWFRRGHAIHRICIGRVFISIVVLLIYVKNQREELNDHDNKTVTLPPNVIAHSTIGTTIFLHTDIICKRPAQWLICADKNSRILLFRQWVHGMFNATCHHISEISKCQLLECLKWWKEQPYESFVSCNSLNLINASCPYVLFKHSLRWPNLVIPLKWDYISYFNILKEKHLLKDVFIHNLVLNSKTLSNGLSSLVNKTYRRFHPQKTL